MSAALVAMAVGLVMPAAPAAGAVIQDLFDENWTMTTDSAVNARRGVRFTPTEEFTVYGFSWFAKSGTIQGLTVDYTFSLFEFDQAGTTASLLVDVTEAMSSGMGSEWVASWNDVMLPSGWTLNPGTDYALIVESPDDDALPGDNYLQSADLPADVGLVEVVAAVASPTFSRSNGLLMPMRLIIPEPASIVLVGGLGLGLLMRRRSDS